MRMISAAASAVPSLPARGGSARSAGGGEVPAINAPSPHPARYARHPPLAGRDSAARVADASTSSDHALGYWEDGGAGSLGPYRKNSATSHRVVFRSSAVARCRGTLTPHQRVQVGRQRLLIPVAREGRGIGVKRPEFSIHAVLVSPFTLRSRISRPTHRVPGL
jgi:hypothetical protein